MKVKIFFLVLSLTLFHTGTGQTSKLLINGEVYRFQNSYDNRFLTSAASVEHSAPSGIMTNDLDLSKREQLWEVNVASRDNENKTRVLIRTLKYSNNNATFELKFCPRKQIRYKKVVSFYFEAVDPSQTYWYLKRAVWHWKNGKREREWSSSKCLTTYKDGTVGFSQCNTNTQNKLITTPQQWKIFKVDM